MCLHVYELDNDWIDYFILQNDNSVGRGLLLIESPYA